MKCKSLIRIIVCVVQMGFRRDHTLFLRVKDYNICIAALTDHTFSGIYSIESGCIFTQKSAHLLFRDLSCSNTVSIKQGTSCLNSRQTSRNLGEIILSQSLLLHGKTALVCGNRLDLSVCQSLPQAILVFFLTDRRCTDIFRPFEIRSGVNTVIQCRCYPALSFC